MVDVSPLNSPKLKMLGHLSVPGRAGVQLPSLDVPEQEALPEEFLRECDTRLPELSELDVVRYFTNLSQKNFSVDTNFYPLGSCTMKYNPKINDVIASLPGFAKLHPLQDTNFAQGSLELMYELQSSLMELTGFAGSSLATLAGAQGELAGVLMIKAYHESNGDSQRNLILIPDSAHGTNPASASMAGFSVATIPSDSNGNMDVQALRILAKENLAGAMITLPSTLGLFDTSIVEICKIIHEAGGLIYCDGANMNAILGRARLFDLGFDVVHLNLHKTLSTPHGGGGPGSGPVCVSEKLLPFLPSPIVKKSSNLEGSIYNFVDPVDSIGKVAAFHGNFGVLVRAYAFVRALGLSGLRQVSGDAVLNANYILSSLKDVYKVAFDRKCMHELVLSLSPQKSKGVKAIDVSKRLIDYGVHPPTMYFPLIVEEALMIEPTESENKQTLDIFIDIMRKIAIECEENPDLILSSPVYAPIGRLDEVMAARRPDLRQVY
jgi:glycine dehydrogenase subunit 2